MDVFVCGGTRQAGWAEAMLGDIAAALRDLGLGAQYVPFDAESESLASGIRERARRRQPFFVFTLNAKGPFGGVPSFNLLVDDPIYHVEGVLKNRRFSAFGTIDRRHTDFRRVGIAVDRPVRFMPHAGPAPVSRPRPMGERDIGLLVVGNIDFEPRRERWAERFRADDPLREIFLATVERCIAEYADPVAALRAELARRSVDPADLPAGLFARLAVTAEACFVSHVRFKLLASARHARVTVVGRVPGPLLAGHENLDLLGVRPFAEVLGLMARARIVVDATPKHAHGSHERIWYGLSRGAVVATTDNGFLREVFADGRSMLFLPRGCEELCGRIADTAADARRLEDIRAAAAPIYAGGHTWTHRLADLGAVMAPVAAEWEAAG